MGMFGRGPTLAKGGTIAGFNPAGPSWIDKAGLVGDILTGDHSTKTRLDDDFAFAQQKYAAQHPMPQYIPGIGLVQTHADGAAPTIALAEPPKLPAVAQNAQYLNSVTPGSGDAYLHNFAANGGGQGPGVITVNGQQMMRAPSAGVPQQPPAEAVSRLRANPHEAAMFDQTFGLGASARILNGGAAPSLGPGGFPFYPGSH